MAEPRAASSDGAETLRLTVIGSAAAWSLQSGRPSSCYLLEFNGAALVLDLGQGSMSHLAERRTLESVLAVIVSHLHPDHHVDLVPLRHYLAYGLAHSATVTLHAPPELRSRYDAFLGQQGFLDPLPGADVRDGTWNVGPFTIEARPVTHAPHAYAVRVSRRAVPSAPALVYSGDCGRWQDMVPLLRAGDTLLSEAYWGVAAADAGEMHLRAGDAARAAVEGRAGRLILTHIAESQDPDACRQEARQIFAGPVDVARPGLSVRIE